MHATPSNVQAAKRFENLMLKGVGSGNNEKRVRTAFEQARVLYGDAMHWSGETLLEHCVGALETFMRFNPDDDAMVACLLHHALDAKSWTLDDLEREEGAAVRTIVSGMHLLSHVTMKNRRTSMENLRMMFMRVSDDMHVVLLILCNQTYNLRHLHARTPETQRIVCRDVLHLFAPVAARLGIYSLKHEMEAQAFPVVYPIDAARIKEQLDQLHEKSGDFLGEASSQLAEYLAEYGVQATIEVREKQPFSIFQKMRMKSITHVEDLYDLFALRVVVENMDACYQTLGILHRIGHPVANRFKDYIAFPKPNGYQSLHTTLARLPGVPEGTFVEVQIRTKEMHRESELGIAAHWSYKEGGKAQYAAKRAQLQRALTLQHSLNEAVTASMSDHIFVLTPNGDIVELPEGATPLDFAFQVHTALGLSFRAARVNGSIVPLTHALENGDIVEVLKHKDPHPSPNWLQLLKTTSAKSRLKRFLSTQNRPDNVSRGKEILNQELLRHKLPQLDPDLTVLRFFRGKKMTFAEREDMLASLGQGAQNASSLLPHLHSIGVAIERAKKSGLQKLPPPVGEAVARVKGSIPMPIRHARCCRPDEGKREALEGVIGRDGSVRVHRHSCKLLRNVNPERRIDVVWKTVEKKISSKAS